jgi:hypothetical protein
MPSPSWTEKARLHSLQHRMADGLFVTGLCTYCGLSTIDLCPECSAFVCRRCDVREHWAAVGIVPASGFRPPIRPFRR